MKNNKVDTTQFPYNIPDHALESLARCALPLVREFYATEEGRKYFESGRRKIEIMESDQSKKRQEFLSLLLLYYASKTLLRSFSYRFSVTICRAIGSRHSTRYAV